jgi:hypothetical protein
LEARVRIGQVSNDSKLRLNHSAAATSLSAATAKDYQCEVGESSEQCPNDANIFQPK